MSRPDQTTQTISQVFSKFTTVGNENSGRKISLRTRFTPNTKTDVTLRTEGNLSDQLQARLSDEIQPFHNIMVGDASEADKKITQELKAMVNALANEFAEEPFTVFVYGAVQDTLESEEGEQRCVSQGVPAERSKGEQGSLADPVGTVQQASGAQ